MDKQGSNIDASFDAEVASYGSVVGYAENKTINYPDFKITYVGKEVIDKGGTYKPGFTHFNFIVESAKNDVQCWIKTEKMDEVADCKKSSDIQGKKYYFGYSQPSNRGKIYSSPGTGEISETEFRVAGKSFFLDLAPRKNGKFLNSGTNLIIHDHKGERQ